MGLHRFRIPFLFFCGYLILPCAAWPAVDTQRLVPGRFGSALNANRAAARVPADAAFPNLPLTVECWAMAGSKAQFNIIIANETKASPTHWELFTMPGSGHLCAYLPGRAPNHARTRIDIADGRWHYLAFILEPARARLYIDGIQGTDVVLSPPVGNRQPGPLSIGSLSEGGIGCNGRIDEVRITRGARAIAAVPAAPLAVDTGTIALWRFDALDGQAIPNAVAAAPEARLTQARTAAVQSGGFATKSTACQPLPPPEDAAPLREALAGIAAWLDLKTIPANPVRDAVLRQWSYDFTWHGNFEYPKSRNVFY